MSAAVDTATGRMPKSSAGNWAMRVMKTTGLLNRIALREIG